MTKRMFSVLLLVLMVFWPATVLAQGTTPTPVTTFTVVVMALSVLLGFINQGISQGSILNGVVKVPPTWLRYLTISATFLGGGIASLTSSDTVTTATVLLAVDAGFRAAISAGGGIALAHHMGQPKRTAKTKAATAIAVSCLALVLMGCSSTLSPAQQVQDGTALEGCVAANWGKTPEVVAVACLNSELPTALDVIADVEALIESLGSTSSAQSPYAADARVMALVPVKLAAMTAVKK
jgi:hypothetical protein